MEKRVEINWKKCNKCKFIQHPSHLRCLKCKNDKFTLIEPRGNCVLISYTILKSPPAEFLDQKSYTLGIVEFENGIRLLGQIVSNQDLKIGMYLNPLYKKFMRRINGNEFYSLIFEPLDKNQIK